MTEQSARLSPAAIEQLRYASTASITTQLLKRGFRTTFLRGLVPLCPDERMVGHAFTLRYVPAREDVGMYAGLETDDTVQWQAVEQITPGDVLVIDARGDTRAASYGHILATRLHRRGVAGLVTDGALRDSPRFPELGLPAYSQAAHATTSGVIHHSVDTNVPIGCAGVLVLPGDVMVGDAEGVVVIPAAHAESVAHDAYEQELLEDYILEKVENGTPLAGVYPPYQALRDEYARARPPIAQSQP
jgi:regulator of RNase E activity RraA